MNGPHDWDQVLGLYARLERNEALETSDELHSLCRRVAKEVAIADEHSARALLTQQGTEALVREMRRRIFEGSRRLSKAFAESDRHKQKGDTEGARKALEEVLAVEVVPLYRQHAMTLLDYVDDPED